MSYLTLIQSQVLKSLQTALEDASEEAMLEVISRLQGTISSTWNPLPSLSSRRFELQLPPHISQITEIAHKVYLSFPYLGKEGHFQEAFQAELHLANFFSQRELITPLHYTLSNGTKIQLSSGISGRQDLVLPKRKLILELKQTAAKSLTSKEFHQLCQYMETASSNWGLETTGLLINFGTNQFEVWYLLYDENQIKRYCILSKAQTHADVPEICLSS